MPSVVVPEESFVPDVVPDVVPEDLPSCFELSVVPFVCCDCASLSFAVPASCDCWSPWLWLLVATMGSVLPMPCPDVARFTMSAYTRTAATAATTITMAMRLRTSAPLRLCAASRTLWGAMGVPESATPASLAASSRLTGVAHACVVPELARRSRVAPYAPSAEGAWSDRFLSFCADALSIPLYTCDAMVVAAAATPTPMMEPASPILDCSANDVTAASALAMTADPENSLRTPFFCGSSASCCAWACPYAWYGWYCCVCWLAPWYWLAPWGRSVCRVP